MTDVLTVLLVCMVGVIQEIGSYLLAGPVNLIIYIFTWWTQYL